jgi:uncharacterized paraquat-inducible protein A
MSPVDVNVDVGKLSNAIVFFATISIPISYLLAVLLLLPGKLTSLATRPASSKGLLHVLSPTLKVSVLELSMTRSFVSSVRRSW